MTLKPDLKKFFRFIPFGANLEQMGTRSDNSMLNLLKPLLTDRFLLAVVDVTQKDLVAASSEGVFEECSRLQEHV